MTSSGAARVLAQFDFHTPPISKNVIEGISDNDSLRSAKTEQINNIKWIAGHMLNTRALTP